MIPPIMMPQQEEKENYNETVLIPVLQQKMNDLTAEVVLLQAKLKIAEKENKKSEDSLRSEIESLKTALEASRSSEKNSDKEPAYSN